MTPPSAAAAPAVQPRRPLAPPRRLTTAPRPRRVSGPARPARRPLGERSGRRLSAEPAGIALGLIEALNSLSQHRLLDRLIRGRTWIALVAFALIGIVTLQLGLLKLNAGIGRSLQHEASLQRTNAALSIENSELAAGDLVESSAARLGMEMVPVGSLRFLTARPQSDPGRGAATLSTPVGGSSAATGEASSGSTPASSSGSSASAESSEAQSSESQASQSAGSESEAAKAPSSEASAPRASSETSGEQSTATAPPAASAGTGAGSAEPSGGTQAGSTGR